MTAHYIIGGAILLLVIAFWVVATFNGLVRLRNLMQEAWSGIDVQLKRRHSLIPNLVEVVKGYGGHERGVLEGVTKARAESTRSQGVKETEATENELSQRLKSLFAVVEQYPDLKANTNFLDLQKQLSEVEDQIQYARRYYNGTVRDLNIRIESFPSNVVAGLFRFRRAEFFQLETVTDRAAPEVEL